MIRVSSPRSVLGYDTISDCLPKMVFAFTSTMLLVVLFSMFYFIRNYK